MKNHKLLSKPIGYTLFSAIGLLFCFFCRTGKDLAEQGNIIWTGNYVIKILVFSLVCGVLLGSFLCFLFYAYLEDKWSEPAIFKKKETKLNALLEKISSVKSRWVFSVCFPVILLAWIPAYLAYYPAICAYDTDVQLAQILTPAYNTHHPIAHTLLLDAAINMGKTFFGSAGTGVGILTFLQMTFLAGVFAFGIAFLHRFKIKTVWLCALLLYGMFYPFHWYMSISTSKDAIFSAFFLLQMLVMFGSLVKNRQSLGWDKQDILLLGSTIGMVLFRNNGKYAVLVLLVVLIPACLWGKSAKKLFGRIWLVCVTAFVIGNVILAVLTHVTNAVEGDKREMLSMPIQQLARCMVYHGGAGVLAQDDNTIDEADKALINEFLLNESYKEYRPDISDPVKRHTNTYVVRYRTKEFVDTYLRLLADYPGDFVNAALAVNAGYLYPGDTSHAYVNQYESKEGLGYVQTRWVEDDLNAAGIYKDSKLPVLHEKLEKWAEENAYLKIPVLKYLFMPGTYLWLYCLVLGYLLLQKKYRMCVPFSLVGGYYITLFLGPTVQLRYIYPIMIILPFVGLLCAKRMKEKKF